MRALTLASLALLVATPAAAQHWTAEEREVIDVNNRCWGAWAEEDMSAVVATCNEHPEAVFWFTNTAAPRTGWFEEHGKTWVTEVYWPRTDVIHFEVQPLKVSVIDDVALIHNWVLYIEEDTNGERRELRERRLDILKRIGDRWSWIGGMVSPES